VTVLTAMASILTAARARRRAMTVRSRCAAGAADRGIKEKVLGRIGGDPAVLLPAHNEADLDDIPADLRKQMQLVLVESIDQC